MLIATAYQVPVFRISDGPAWAGSNTFDIEARAEDPNTGRIQLRIMMQSLLDDRFRHRLHKESRTSSIYSLAVSKKGAKISRSADQASADATGALPKAEDGPPRGGVLLGRVLDEPHGTLRHQAEMDSRN